MSSLDEDQRREGLAREFFGDEPDLTETVSGWASYIDFEGQQHHDVDAFVAAARDNAKVQERYEQLQLELKPASETILEEAQRLVHGDRGGNYGHPIEDFSRTGQMWGAILSKWRDSDEDSVPPELVGLCMAAVKISREVNLPKRDNRVDLAGYAETVQMIHERIAEPGP